MDLISHFHRKQTTDCILFKVAILRSISYYSTAATSDAAYIIGGYPYYSTIAEFKDNQWRKLGDLEQQRYGHGSISDGLRTMVVGGYTNSG